MMAKRCRDEQGPLIAEAADLDRPPSRFIMLPTHFTHQASGITCMDWINRIGPWLLLALGVFSLLQVTVFYQSIQKFWLWYFQTQVAKRTASQGGMSKWHNDMSRKSVISPKLRMFNIVLSCAMIAGAIIWVLYR
jgi:hypothetical protein